MTGNPEASLFESFDCGKVVDTRVLGHPLSRHLNLTDNLPLVQTVDRRKVLGDGICNILKCSCPHRARARPSLPLILADSYDALEGTIGTVAGSMGETSSPLILLGGLYLIYKRVITWHIPLAMLGMIAVLAGSMNILDPDQFSGPVYHMVSGATLLGAFFIATDLVTSPVSPRGQILFGAGCGLLVYVIRTWTGYPEGVAFAVMLMNACTPLIDHRVRPRIYGRDRKGAPLDWILEFDGLSLSDPAPERWAVKKDGGGFDQFTGATITPRAVVKAVKEGAEILPIQPRCSAGLRRHSRNAGPLSLGGFS